MKRRRIAALGIVAGVVALIALGIFWYDRWSIADLCADALHQSIQREKITGDKDLYVFSSYGNFGNWNRIIRWKRRPFETETYFWMKMRALGVFVSTGPSNRIIRSCASESMSWGI